MRKNYFATVVLITVIVLRNDTKSIKSMPIHTFYLESNAYTGSIIVWKSFKVVLIITTGMFTLDYDNVLIN